MKIAFFSDCFLDLTGGIVTSINTQKKALESLGHTVYVFSSSYPKSEQEKKRLRSQNIFPVPSCKVFFRGIVPIARRPKIVEKWLMANHPEIKDFDIFYIHYEGGCSIAGLRLGKELNIPTIQVMHGREDVGEANLVSFGFRTIVAFFLCWFHSWYLPHKTKVQRDNNLADTVARAKMWALMVNHANCADLVLTPSEHFRKKLIHFGLTSPSEVFPNGYPDAKYPESPKLKTVNPGETMRIIWHSRVSSEKRIMPFLKALTRVTGKYQLDVYGGGNHLAKAKRFARHHHLNAVFHGDISFKKIQSSIENAHLDVLVSYDFDTFGMTLIEAEAHGVPVLFCDPDMQEIVPKGSFVMSKNETEEAIADALNDLLSHPERIEKMSQVMLRHRNEVLMSKRIKQLEKIFESEIAKSKK
ncbi:glycosyltransferase [Candidatus Saccharibacteria bacterium]|nr:glycosyltransferase [Candidatus Saccharibacteria bacterium]